MWRTATEGRLEGNLEFGDESEDVITERGAGQSPS
jgi:hypothetical protein